MDPDNHHQQHGVTETTSFLRPENGAESTGKKQESWSDLKPFIRPLVAINFLSIVCGLNDGSIGAIIPRLKDYYDVSNQTVSMLFLCNSFGYFVSAIANGYLVQKFGQLGTIYFGASVLVFGYSVIAYGFPFYVMAVLMVLQGAGVALLDAAMNVYATTVPMATMMLNLVHAIYGVGAMLSPLIAGVLLDLDISWRGIYAVMALISLFNLILVRVGLHDADLHGKSEESDQVDKEMLQAALLHRMTILGAIYILIYVGLEVTMGGWSITYMIEGRHADQAPMTRVVAGYWAALAAGRIVLGYVAEKFGEKRTVSVLTAATGVVLLVIWYIPNIVVDSIAIVTVGFLLGPMFPSTVSLASKVLPRRMHPAAIGFMAGTGAGGAAFFPFLTGQISGYLGILSMPLVCLAMAITMQVLWTFVPSKQEDDV
ncbi:hypothetical protein LRAMOSA00345 [Lichtheimia ramosa]|uniref:Major facilitator superfamily (MFS) profile domain-containing protein n=1 Tax=Lichtheimia ramosa TaxID=688394 RepID=A0A077WA19_9FUNG|nr:hypothetical protein LRAMOSA00345 [Lichtheimia ramosa]